MIGQQERLYAGLIVVDQAGRKPARRVPVGIFAMFANHGTVDHEHFRYLIGDRQGAAERVVEAAIRADVLVPTSQAVVNAGRPAASGRPAGNGS